MIMLLASERMWQEVAMTDFKVQFFKLAFSPEETCRGVAGTFISVDIGTEISWLVDRCWFACKDMCVLCNSCLIMAYMHFYTLNVPEK